MTKTKINMTQADFDEWIAALRSGEYEQGYGRLCRYDLRDGKDERSYCCLGVYAKLHDMFDPLPEHPAPQDVMYLKDPDGLGSECYLPGDLISAMEQRTIAEMNDNSVSFEDIATYIEANFEPAL